METALAPPDSSQCNAVTTDAWIMEGAHKVRGQRHHRAHIAQGLLVACVARVVLQRLLSVAARLACLHIAQEGLHALGMHPPCRLATARQPSSC